MTEDPSSLLNETSSSKKPISGVNVYLIYLVGVEREVLHGVDDEQGRACVGVGQVACIALTHDMQRTGLVEKA